MALEVGDKAPAFSLATDGGVFTAEAGQGSHTSWSRLGQGLPNAAVDDLTVGPDNCIYATAHGHANAAPHGDCYPLCHPHPNADGGADRHSGLRGLVSDLPGSQGQGHRKR